MADRRDLNSDGSGNGQKTGDGSTQRPSVQQRQNAAPHEGNAPALPSVMAQFQYQEALRRQHLQRMHNNNQKSLPITHTSNIHGPSVSGEAAPNPPSASVDVDDALDWDMFLTDDQLGKKSASRSNSPSRRIGVQNSVQRSKVQAQISGVEQLKCVFFKDPKNFQDLYAIYLQKSGRNAGYNSNPTLFHGVEPVYVFEAFLKENGFEQVRKSTEAVGRVVKSLHLPSFPVVSDISKEILKYYEQFLMMFELFYVDKQENLLKMGIISQIAFKSSSYEPSVDAESISLRKSDSVENRNGNEDDDERRLVYIPSFGHYDIDYIVKSFYGNGEAKTKLPHSAKEDLGQIDLYELFMTLQCANDALIENAMSIILILSADAAFDFKLVPFQPIIDVLVQKWEQGYQELCLKPRAANTETEFWSYDEIVTLENHCVDALWVPLFRSMTVEDRNYDRFHGIRLKTNQEAYRMQKRKRLAETCLMLGIIFKNITMTQVNAEMLCRNSRFIAVFLKWLQFEPVTAKSRFFNQANVEDESSTVEISDFHGTFSQTRKNILYLSLNLAPWIKLTSVEHLSLILNTCLDLGKSCCDFIGPRASLSIHSLIQPPENDTSWATLNCIKSLLGSSSLEKLMYLVDSDICNDIIEYLMTFIPPGTSLQSSSSQTNGLRPYDFVFVECALVALSHASYVWGGQVAAFISKHDYMKYYLRSLLNGLTWHGTCVYTTDPDYQTHVISRLFKPLSFLSNSGARASDIARTLCARSQYLGFRIMCDLIYDAEESDHINSFELNSSGYGGPFSAFYEPSDSSDVLPCVEIQSDSSSNFLSFTNDDMVSPASNIVPLTSPRTLYLENAVLNLMMSVGAKTDEAADILFAFQLLE